MNDEVVLEWKCNNCETVNRCTIGKANKQTQRCSKCNKPYYVNVEINIIPITEFKFSTR